MAEKMKDLCSNVYVGTAMTLVEVLREDIGLARAIETSAKIWSRLGNNLAPIIQETYNLSETSIPKIAEALNTFMNEALNFESTVTESGDEKAIITVKPCLEWTKFKEASLPPLCYRLCYSMMESIVKQWNMELNFQPGAQMRQGADRCELVISK